MCQQSADNWTDVTTVVISLPCSPGRRRRDIPGPAATWAVHQPPRSSWRRVLYLVDAAVFVKGSKVVADENRRVRGSWATEGYPTSSSAGGTTGTDSAALRSSESGSADVREGPLGLRVSRRAVLSAAHYVDVDEDGLRPDLEARINAGRATARRGPRRSLTITFREPDANNGNVDVERLAGHASRVRSPLRQLA
jgi:hypothetical protein